MINRQSTAYRRNRAKLSLSDFENLFVHKALFQVLSSGQATIRLTTCCANEWVKAIDYCASEALFSQSGSTGGLERRQPDWKAGNDNGKDKHEHVLRKSWLIEQPSGRRPISKGLRVIWSTAVTREFQRRVRRFFNRIPKPLNDAVSRNKTQILLVGNIAEVDWKLVLDHSKQHGRHQIKDTPIAGPSVLYDPQFNAIIFSEQLHLDASPLEMTGKLPFIYNLLKEPGKLFFKDSNSRAYELLKRNAAHEFGHALDNALSRVSASPEFDEAFQKDLAKLTDDEKLDLRYLVHLDSSFEVDRDAYGRAKEEIFAELIAVGQKLTGTVNRCDDLLKKKFPALVELLKLIISKLARG